MKKICLIFIILAILVGCRSIVQYNPNANISLDRAKAIIKQVIEEQPAYFSPTDIEITDSYLKMINQRAARSFWTGGVTTMPIATVVYYKNIGEMRLVKKRNRYWIGIFNKDRVLKCTIFSSNESKAKEFIDAIYSLQFKLE